MGVSGSGKSTVGSLAARALDCRFLEGDSFHDPAAIAKMQGGVPLSDEDRWPWLDRIAAAAGQAIADDGRVVIACSALRRAYRDRLRSAIPGTTRFVMLDNSREEILQRLTARSHEFMPVSLLDSQFAVLERPAADEPATILLSNVRPDALCTQILGWMGSVQSAG
ncbi:gluconokinase [Sphingomonas ginkgonis]|uniref:Gluconokinase n=2 Tax=Sphingomonas ginkgonis TaxID=2315330 RepID=A0A429VDZ9_9SPHN|nr:gluconokinase [Sphingomonas ginkgonis]RST32163.1 gluconokinase [Sphingomonas ginkgonis]